jgi:hypothetical protein
LKVLREKRYEVAGFFYNPNIHPLAEYLNRRKAVEDYSQKLDLEVIYPEYAPQDFFQAINLKEQAPARCALCWTLRFENTAQFAKNNGFDSFTSTLLVSPYQDQEMLKKIGASVAAVSGVDFYYEDFRPGFRPAHNEARSQGIYCQKYCGCLYSGMERCKKSA